MPAPTPQPEDVPAPFRGVFAELFGWPPFPSTKDIRAHPVFRGEISRWLWKVYTHRFTPAGLWFLLSTVFFMIYGSSSLDLQGYIPFCYAVGLWAIALLAAFVCEPRVRLRAQHAERICAGETLSVEVEIEQRGRMIGANLWVLPEGLPPALDAVPHDGEAAPALTQGQKGRVQIGLRCPRRGVYQWQGFRVETDFPFGLLRAYHVFKEKQSLLVYPKFTPLNRLAIPTGRRYQPGGVIMASTLGDSFEYIGNREYQEGDPIRDIDWRATARLSKAIVREYREEYFLRVAVILDTYVPRRARAVQHQAFEGAVSVCAAVSDAIARQEYIVDLFAAGPNLYHLTAGRSLAYLDQILDILACVDENPKEPFETLEPEILENLAQITTILCVFLDWNETRRAFVHRMSLAGAAMKVIIVRDAPCTLDPAVDDLAGNIRILSSADVEAGPEDL